MSGAQTDELVISHCLGFIATKSSPGDRVRRDLDDLRYALRRGYTLNLLKQLKQKLIDTFDALHTEYVKNPSYGNSVFFSPKVERLLHEHLERLHTVMRKYNASVGDLEFPDKWFDGVQIRGGSTWNGPEHLRSRMFTSTMSELTKKTSSEEMNALLQQLKELNSLDSGHVSTKLY